MNEGLERSWHAFLKIGKGKGLQFWLFVINRAALMSTIDHYSPKGCENIIFSFMLVQYTLTMNSVRPCLHPCFAVNCILSKHMTCIPDDSSYWPVLQKQHNTLNMHCQKNSACTIFDSTLQHTFVHCGMLFCAVRYISQQVNWGTIQNEWHHSTLMRLTHIDARKWCAQALKVWENWQKPVPTLALSPYRIVNENRLVHTHRITYDA